MPICSYMQKKTCSSGCWINLNGYITSWSLNLNQSKKEDTKESCTWELPTRSMNTKFLQMGEMHAAMNTPWKRMSDPSQSDSVVVSSSQVPVLHSTALPQQAQTGKLHVDGNTCTDGGLCYNLYTSMQIWNNSNWFDFTPSVNANRI